MDFRSRWDETMRSFLEESHFAGYSKNGEFCWPALLQDLSDTYGDRVAFEQKGSDGWNQWTFREVVRGAFHLALQIGASDVGDRVLSFTEGRPEAGLGLFACALLGMTLVPLDIKLERNELKELVQRSGAKVILLSPSFFSEQEFFSGLGLRVLSLGDLGEIKNQSSAYSLGILKPSVRLGKPLVLIYTSGTTQAPKGVLLSHRNLLFVIQAINRVILPSWEDRYLSVLPVNHAFELNCGLLRPFLAGATVTYATSPFPQEILALLKEKRILTMLTVPLFIRALKKVIETKLSSNPKTREWWSQVKEEDVSKLSLEERRKKFARALELLGGEFENFTSGGAPLEPEVSLFFERMGIVVLQGYGLTETAPTCAVNTFEWRKPESVGRPLPGVEVKIDGELWIRSPGVMLGYDQDPELTRSVLTADGWFKTGDLAELDSDGFLHIVGRATDLIVLSSGKKVSPEEVEMLLGTGPGVQELCVIGMKSSTGLNAGFEEVGVVLSLEPEKFKNPEDVELVLQDLKQRSQMLTSFKRPTRVIWVSSPLPKTTTRKFKRKAISSLIAEWEGAGALKDFSRRV